MAVATPLITTSPCWLVHTVSSLTIFFSGNSSRTVDVYKRQLDTFVDPRLEGGKMNRAAHEAGDMVKLIELEGEEKLFYPAFPIDIAVIRATYADERGNCTFEREGVYAEALAQAQAAHNSGGRVIVQVEKVVSYGCLDARLIRLPGIYVDALVVARPENHMQTFGLSLIHIFNLFGGSLYNLQINLRIFTAVFKQNL